MSPIILVLDGVASHISEDLTRYCDDNNVVIMRIPPHTSHLIQPLHCGINACLKQQLDFFMEKTKNKFVIYSLFFLPFIFS